MQNWKRNYLKPRVRRFIRKILGYITLRTLQKHQPIIISVAGGGPTSLIREAIFSVVTEKLPTRRNIELPEAEFSIPLTVLGYPDYPSSYSKWIWVIIKSFIQLFTVKAFKHALVLELKPSKTSVMAYWLSILNPEILIQLGTTVYEFTPTDFGLFRNYNIDDSSTAGYEHIATEVGNYLHMDSLDIELGLAAIRFPEARIRLLPGINSSTVVDATHYYFPLKLASVLETISTGKGRLIAFTDYELDQQLLTAENWEVNPLNFTPLKNDTVLLRGRRADLIVRHGNIINRLQAIAG